MIDFEKVIADDSEFLLSTVDNPYNPFSHWDEWLAFDTEKGYSTCGLLARLSENVFNDNMSDEWNDMRLREAIDNFIEIDPLRLYCKVDRNGKKTPSINVMAVTEPTQED